MKVTAQQLVVASVAFTIGLLTANALAAAGTNLSLAAMFDAKYAVIWSGVIGAVIASGLSYFGVRSANSSSLARLNAQHEHDAAEAIKERKHDAEQKDEDRKAAIRREVYVKAVEEVHATLAAIGGMAERPLSEIGHDVDALQAFLKANAKVWLVAEAEASHLSRDLASLVSECYLAALKAAAPLRLRMEPARDLDRKLPHAEAEVVRLDGRLTDLRTDLAKWEEMQMVNTAWRQANEWVTTLKQERQRLLLSLAPDKLALGKAMFDELRPVQRAIVRLVSALRSELHLPPDEAMFLAQLADMEKRAMAALNRAFGITE